eukprot:CAMPEP_0179459318 /NCGR_PEP_ID=MMETSP0799-20121207/42678_1 /TAXON_ID=46947 /ORGANISM="Geminigera cryophila, Strain CCMP2564" /LENGTH=473 /DNA_ID=CAMNT_0021261069 /DNA_START=411 /DNA_END=1832 /DNA_ORIENTATION=+
MDARGLVAAEQEHDAFDPGALPGSPLFMDQPHAAMSQATSRLDALSPPSHRPPSAGPELVVISDGDFVYMMTSQQGAVQLNGAVAVQSDEHAAILGSTSRRDLAGQTQSRGGVMAVRTGFGSDPGADSRAGDSDDVTVVIDLVRKVWIADESDIARERGDQADDLASCPICLEPMFSGRAVVTSCSHCFHIGCCRKSESVSIGTSGFWACPSCREPITTIHARTVKGGHVSGEMDTTPLPGNAPNLTYVLKRNPAMQSVIRNLLLLEDYVVGSRGKGPADVAVGLQPATIETVQKAVVREFDAHMPPILKDDGMHMLSEPTLTETKHPDTPAALVAGSSQNRLRAADIEAGALTKATASDEDVAKETGIVVPAEHVGTYIGRAIAAGPACMASKGQPGMLSATVEMSYLLLPMGSSSGNGHSEGLQAQLDLVSVSDERFQRAHRQRRFCLLGFMAFIVIKIIFVIVLWMMGSS